MTLDQARKIAQSVPGIKFSITALDHGMGIALAGDIDIVESFASRLPVTDSYIESKHVCIGYAFTDDRRN